MFDVALAVGKSGQFLAGKGVPALASKLPGRVGDHPEQAAVLLAERGRDLRRRTFCTGVEQRAGHGARSCGQFVQGVEHRTVGPRHLPADRGSRIPPQALPRVSCRRARLLR